MCTKKYFSYITDKIVSLGRNFSKALVILSWFFFFFIIFINSIHQPSILRFFKVSFFTSLLNKYMKVWYFYVQYKASCFGTNKICYIFDLRHVSKLAAHFKKRSKMFLYLLKYPNEESQESGKY